MSPLELVTAIAIACANVTPKEAKIDCYETLNNCAVQSNGEINFGGVQKCKQKLNLK